MTAYAYEESAVSIIDILGFSAAVCRLKDDTTGELQKRIDAALGVLIQTEEVLESDFGKKYLNPEGKLRVTMFSDTVLSTTTADNALRLIAEAHSVGTRLMQVGFLPRGSIVKGLSYHNERVFFGEAVVKAHKIESEQAHTPRILVSDDIAAEFRSLIDNGFKGISPNILRQDLDGRWFVNIYDGPTGYLLANKHADWSPSDILKYWSGSLKCIEAGLQSNKAHAEVFAKFVWAANHHNELAPAEFKVRLGDAISKRPSD